MTTGGNLFACIVQNTLIKSSGGKFGGVVGNAQYTDTTGTSLTRCYNLGFQLDLSAIIVQGIRIGRVVGGANSYCSFSKCGTNQGLIHQIAADFAGGVVGYLNAPLVFDQCYSGSRVKVISGNPGAIVGGNSWFFLPQDAGHPFQYLFSVHLARDYHGWFFGKGCLSRLPCCIFELLLFFCFPQFLHFQMLRECIWTFFERSIFPLLHAGLLQH